MEPLRLLAVREITDELQRMGAIRYKAVAADEWPLRSAGKFKHVHFKTHHQLIQSDLKHHKEVRARENLSMYDDVITIKPMWCGTITLKRS